MTSIRRDTTCRLLLVAALLCALVRADGNYDTRPVLAWTQSGSAAGGRFGHALALGDYNADGATDVAVSAYLSSSGSVLGYFGGGGAFETSPGFTTGAQSGATMAGIALSAGQFSATGTDEFLLAEMISNGNDEPPAVRFKAPSTRTTYSGDGGIRLGRSAVVGNFNGATADAPRNDVVIGSPSRDVGNAVVYYDGATKSSAVLTPDYTNMQPYSLAGYYGAALAAGRFQNGWDDLVACGFGDGPLCSRGGRCVLYKGGSAGLPTNGAKWSWQFTDNQTTDSIGENFGWVVATVNVNGDGYDDLVVGSPSGVTGKVYVFHGSAGGLSSTPNAVLSGAAAVDFFGSAVVAAGDLNRDGYTDILVGAPRGGPNSEGRVYAFAGGPNGLSTTALWYLQGTQTMSMFGHAVAGGKDIDGDGYADVIVGAPCHDINGATKVSSARGAAFLYKSVAIADFGVTVSMPASLSVTPAAPQFQTTLTVTNHGPATDASTLSLAISDPAVALAGATGATCSVNAGTCSGTGCDDVTSDAAVVCAVGSLAAGASATVVITLAVPTTYGGDVVTVRAAVSGLTYADPTSINNEVSNDISITSDVSLSLTSFTGDAASRFIGDTETYTAVITNSGPSYANDVVLRMPFVAGLSFVSVSGAPRGCTGTIACDLGSIAPGAAVTVTLAVGVTAAVVASPVHVIASVETSSSNAAGATVQRAFDMTVNVNADLSVSMVAQANALAGDGLVSWAITVVNGGPSDAAGVVLSDTLPAGLTLVTPPTMTVTPAVAQNPTCTVTGAAVSCALPVALPRGYAASVTLYTRTSVNGVSFTNVASVTSTSADLNTANNQASVTTGVVSVNSDISLQMTATPNPRKAGDGLIAIAATIASNGPSDGFDVYFVAAVPSNMDVMSNGTSVVISSGNCSITTSSIVCYLPRMSINTLARLDILARVASSAAFTFAASVNSSSLDMNTANNAASLPNLSASISCDLATTITSTPNPRQAGDGHLVWYVYVVSGGPSDALGTVISVNVPAQSQVNTVAMTVAFAVQPNACTVTGQTVKCNVAGAFTSGSTAVVAIDTLVATNIAPSQYTLSASAQASTPDPTPSNNAATANAYATVSADLSASLVGVDVTGGMSWSMAVANLGPAASFGAVLTVQLPANVDVTSLASTTLNCTSDANNLVTCTPASVFIPSGTVVRVAISAGVRIDQLSPGNQYSAAAAVSSTTPDAVVTNNAATASVTVVIMADVRLTYFPYPTVILGRPVVYSLTATNLGPLQARNPTVTLTLPPGGTMVSPPVILNATAQSDCVVNDTLVTCSLLQMAPLSTATVRALVVFPWMDTPVVTTAAVTNDLPMKPETNHTATIISTMIRQADLEVTVVANDNTPMPRSLYDPPLTFTLTVTNHGYNDAADVRASMVIGNRALDPSIITILPPGNDNCTFDAPSMTVNCSFGGMVASQKIAVQVRVDLQMTDTTPFGVTASVTQTPGPTDPPANNVFSGAQVTPRKNTEADVYVVMNVTTLPALAVWYEGQAVVLSYIVTNRGPFTATDVTFTVELPTVVSVGSVTSTIGACDTGNADGLVTCTIGNLTAAQTTTVTLTATTGVVTAATEVNITGAANATSYDPSMANNAVPLPAVFRPQVVPSDASPISTLATHLASNGPAWWVILLMVVLPLLAAAAVAAGLWRLGFFKRRRPPQADDKDETASMDSVQLDAEAGSARTSRCPSRGPEDEISPVEMDTL